MVINYFIDCFEVFVSVNFIKECLYVLVIFCFYFFFVYKSDQFIFSYFCMEVEYVKWDIICFGKVFNKVCFIIVSFFYNNDRNVCIYVLND